MEKKSNTDWQRVTGMTDSEIDVSDIPPLDESFFNNAVIKMPVAKKSVSLRLDADLLDWFKKQGVGYQTKINAVLRVYMQAMKSR